MDSRKSREMTEQIGELLAPYRLMMTPGPCSIDPRVYRAMTTPLVGHMDPWFTEMIGEVQTLLRRAFQTENRVTFPISASGSGGIEAAVVNPLEPGDEAIVCVNGNFSERIDRKSTRLNSSHPPISYAVFCLKKKKIRCSRRFLSGDRSSRCYPTFFVWRAYTSSVWLVFHLDICLLCCRLPLSLLFSPCWLTS